jgi:hypothetical protein
LVNNNLYNFELFNTTSVMMLFYSCIEMYGLECKQLAIQVLRNFVDWYYDNKQNGYMPERGLEPMYHPRLIEEMLNWCEEQDEYLNKEDAMTKFFLEFNRVETNILQQQKQEEEKSRTKKYLYGSLGVLGATILYNHFR